jgi:NAD(P)-dependent dehydrogenase (short-subunit alcohol dehydrogenase family)
VVVVGASAGIGREVATAAIARGARVVLAARRTDVLADVVAAAGGGHALAVDLTDGAALARFADAAVAELGGIDLVVHTVGYASLRRLTDCDVEQLRRTFEVNVVGVQELLRLLAPHVEPGGIVAVLSSESAERPRPGMVPYAASKAALEVLLEGWRLEHPRLRFSCVAVGATFPTDFGNEFDPELLGPTLDLWQRQGFMQAEFMEPAGVASVLLDTYAAAIAHPGVGIERVVLRSPSPVAGTLDEALGTVTDP